MDSTATTLRPHVSEDTARLITKSMEMEDYDLVAALLYSHLLYYYHDCSWCPLESFPIPHYQAHDMLVFSEREDGEDRVDFTIDLNEVRLRRGYTKEVSGIVGNVWCDRVYEFLAAQGCAREEKSLTLAQIDSEITKPQQFHASVSLKSVLERDYRFDVLPFYPTASEQPWGPTLTGRGDICYNKVRIAGPTRLLKECTDTYNPSALAHSMGICNGTPQHKAGTSVGSVYKLKVCYRVFIRENPIYTMQFRGTTHQGDARPGVAGAAVVIYRQRQPDSEHILVFSYSSFVGRHTDCDYATYVALLCGLARCQELGYTPLVIMSDNSTVTRHLSEGFTRTLGNYLQIPLNQQCVSILRDLEEKNEAHQEALLANSPVEYLDKEKIRRERPRAVTIYHCKETDMGSQVMEESKAAVKKGEMSARGWAGKLYSEYADPVSFLSQDCITDKPIPSIAPKPLGMAILGSTKTLSMIYRGSPVYKGQGPGGRNR